ncbi:MAG TPA: hypothetical protein PK646_01075 [Bacillota bacterium]|jgi:hypothetical protein|nr:hypothetical protein [Fastidiosipila sp.]HPX92936.1 hypothetical protein [Bacillota bacterium]HQB80673.1 hypothetical protein [Bacillota bacterium]
MARERQYLLIRKPDYDRSVRMGRKTLACYSRGKMKRLYPTGAYRLAGEAARGRARNPVAVLRLSQGEKTSLSVSPYLTYSRFFYRSLGYVSVNEAGDRYLELLGPRKELRFMLHLALFSLIALLIVLLYVDRPLFTGSPQYLVPDREPGASLREEGPGQGADREHGGGQVSMIYKDRVLLDRESGILSFYFANPGYSSHEVVLQLVVDTEEKGVIIAESGRIRAGYSLERLALKKGIEMQQGGYNARFNVDCYDPETGEKARVRAHIPVTVDVD